MTDRAFVHDMKNYLGIVIGYSHLLLEEMAADDPRRADVEEIRKAADAALLRLGALAAAAPGDRIA